jgi:hypothetical protein
MYGELISFIKNYPELLPRERLNEIKLIFINLFVKFIAQPSHVIEVSRLFDLVFEHNLLELLADKEWDKAVSLFKNINENLI